MNKYDCIKVYIYTQVNVSFNAEIKVVFGPKVQPMRSSYVHI